MIKTTSLPASENDLLLRALQRQPVPRPPVWLMRQAGRYLPEYNQTRAKAGSFLALCKNPELATEVTMQPLARFGLDAAILFSDILTIPDAMGLGLDFVGGEGPCFQRPLRDEAVIQRLACPDLSTLRYVFDAVALIRKTLRNRIPLIGFSGSPFTLACYMIEGKSVEGFPTARAMLYERPDLFEKILAVLTQTVAAYLQEQIRHGAQVVMIFDSWGGILPTGAYRKYSLAPMRTVLQQLTTTPEGKATPCILFTKGGGQWLSDLVNSGAQGIGLDWTVDLAGAFQRYQNQVAFQGNLDPILLNGSVEAAVRETKVLLDIAGCKPGYIFNLGHGIHPQARIETVAAVVETIKSEH